MQEFIGLAPIFLPENALTALTAPPAARRRSPLHGLRLEVMLTALAARYGWDALSLRIPVRCFTHDPSVTSALQFLRKTPWARARWRVWFC